MDKFSESIRNILSESIKDVGQNLRHTMQAHKDLKHHSLMAGRAQDKDDKDGYARHMAEVDRLTKLIHDNNVKVKSLREDEELLEYKIDPVEAREILGAHGGMDKDFFELNSSTVTSLVDHAKRLGYKKSKSAPGSTGRMFHEYLKKAARKLNESDESYHLKRNEGQYKAERFDKGRVVKGASYGAGEDNTFNSDAPGEFTQIASPEKSHSQFNTGDKVKVSSAYGKSNFKNGVRHTAPHEVISTNATHARVKNIVKGTTHDIPLEHLTAVGKRGRPTLASKGGDKTGSGDRWHAPSGAPSWLMPQRLKEAFDSEGRSEFHAHSYLGGNTSGNREITPAGHTHKLVDKYGRQVATGPSPESLYPHLSKAGAGARIHKILAEGVEPQDGDIIEIDESHIGFKALSDKVGSDALAAYIGNKKYGKKQMHDAATSGKPLSDKDALNEMIDVVISKKDNMYSYEVVCEGNTLFSGSAVTVDGAEIMAHRYVNTMISEYVESLDESTNVLDIVKKIGAKS